jgi:hypothetical protein
MVETTYFVITKAEFDACRNGRGESEVRELRAIVQNLLSWKV